MVYRNKKQQETTNAGRLGAGFISVCLETRWLGRFGGFYVPEPYCRALLIDSLSKETYILSKEPLKSVTDRDWQYVDE